MVRRAHHAGGRRYPRNSANTGWTCIEPTASAGSPSHSRRGLYDQFGLSGLAEPRADCTRRGKAFADPGRNHCPTADARRAHRACAGRTRLRYSSNRRAAGKWSNLAPISSRTDLVQLACAENANWVQGLSRVRLRLLFVSLRSCDRTPAPLRWELRDFGRGGNVRPDCRCHSQWRRALMVLAPR